MNRTIHELEEAKFNSDNIDHCFYVQNLNTPEMQRIPLQNIFNWIKETALKEGLTVKLIDNNIMFIKGKNE